MRRGRTTTGAKAPSGWKLYAALKRRSSTVLPAVVMSPGVAALASAEGSNGIIGTRKTAAQVVACWLRWVLWQVWPWHRRRLRASQSAPQAAPQAWTWEQVKERLELNNPTLLAGKLNISELQADEITAHLRPNPNLGLLSDQIDPFNVGVGHGPFAYLLPSATVSYLIERRNKRGLRTESAKKETAIGISQQDDLERGLLFNLRNAFVQTLQAKAVLRVSIDNLAFCDHVLESAATATKRAILRRSISTGWSCSASSMNPTCKPRK